MSIHAPAPGGAVISLCYDITYPEKRKEKLAVSPSGISAAALPQARIGKNTEN